MVDLVRPTRIPRLSRVKVERRIVQATRLLEDHTRKYQAGNITHDEWDARVRATLIHAHGTLNPRFPDVGQRRALEQLSYFDRFSLATRVGAAPKDGRMLSRIRMYAQALRGTAEEGWRDEAQKRGMRWERRVRGDSLGICPDCARYIAMGWQPIGTLPPLGASVCRTRCKCHFEYSAALDRPALPYNPYVLTAPPAEIDDTAWETMKRQLEDQRHPASQILDDHLRVGYQFTDADEDLVAEYIGILDQRTVGPVWAFKNYVEAEDWIKLNYSHISPDFEFWDVRILNEMLPRFHALSEQWPEVTKHMKYIGAYQRLWKIPASAKEHYNIHTEESLRSQIGTAVLHADFSYGEFIAANLSYVGSYEAMQEYVRRSKSTDRDKYNDFLRSDSIADVFTHEFGHLVDGYIIYRTYAWALLQPLMMSGDGPDSVSSWHELLLNHPMNIGGRGEYAPNGYVLSDYSTYNSREAFAEAFVAHWQDRNGGRRISTRDGFSLMMAKWIDQVRTTTQTQRLVPTPPIPYRAFKGDYLAGKITREAYIAGLRAWRNLRRDYNIPTNMMFMDPDKEGVELKLEEPLKTPSPEEIKRIRDLRSRGFTDKQIQFILDTNDLGEGSSTPSPVVAPAPRPRPPPGRLAQGRNIQSIRKRIMTHQEERRPDPGTPPSLEEVKAEIRRRMESGVSNHNAVINMSAEGWFVGFDQIPFKELFAVKPQGTLKKDAWVLREHPVPDPPEFTQSHEAREWAEAQWPHIRFDFRGMDLKAVRSVLQHLVRLDEQYPGVVDNQIRYVGSGVDREWRSTPLGRRHEDRMREDNSFLGITFTERVGAELGSYIYLNPKYWYSLDVLHQERQGGIMDDWKVNSDDVGTFVHEFGHAAQHYIERIIEPIADEILPKAGQKTIADMIKRMVWDVAEETGQWVSGYAESSGHESFAELFTAQYYEQFGVKNRRGKKQQTEFKRILRLILDILERR